MNSELSKTFNLFFAHNEKIFREEKLHFWNQRCSLDCGSCISFLIRNTQFCPPMINRSLCIFYALKLCTHVQKRVHTRTWRCMSWAYVCRNFNLYFQLPNFWAIYVLFEEYAVRFERCDGSYKSVRCKKRRGLQKKHCTFSSASMVNFFPLLL